MIYLSIIEFLIVSILFALLSLVAVFAVDMGLLKALGIIWLAPSFVVFIFSVVPRLRHESRLVNLYQTKEQSKRERLKSGHSNE